MSEKKCGNILLCFFHQSLFLLHSEKVFYGIDIQNTYVPSGGIRVLMLHELDLSAQIIRFSITFIREEEIFYFYQLVPPPPFIIWKRFSLYKTSRPAAGTFD